MITLNDLARELGCTLADIDDMGIITGAEKRRQAVSPFMADRVRAVWSKRTGIDYTKAAQ